MSISIIGCGDIGRRVAALLDRPQALVHSLHSKALCEQAGLQTSVCDLDTDSVLPPLGKELFYFVPPPRSGQQDTRLRQFLSLLITPVKRVVLISTTGVYGDCGDAWVDETRPINPQIDRAFRRVDAEQALTEWAGAHGTETVILRVPGIYAQDRLPLARLRKRLPLIYEREAPWSNRIHADDLAQMCVAATKGVVAGQVFNISDDAPSTMTAYFKAVADATGLPQPPLISLAEAREQLSPSMLSYLSESRRIRNTKMKQLLGVRLQYPTLADGLRGLERDSGT